MWLKLEIKNNRNVASVYVLYYICYNECEIIIVNNRNILYKVCSYDKQVWDVAFLSVSRSGRSDTV